MTAGYSGTPLPKKLGIKEGHVVGLLDAPPDFERTLGDLPPAVTLRLSARGRLDIALAFVTRRRHLERRLDQLHRVGEHGLIWVCWPKRSSGMETDITEDTVREVALPMGLVDSKVCAVDETWSGLRLTTRKS